MALLLKRFGLGFILPIAAVLTLFGVWFINNLINNIWLVPKNHLAFPIVQSSIVNGTADPTVILQAADRGMLAIFLLCIAIIGTGAALPFAYLINRRLELTRHIPLPNLRVLMRQAIWFGVWLGFCVGLQMGRTFGLPVALLLALVIILIEVLFHVQRQSAELIPE